MKIVNKLLTAAGILSIAMCMVIGAMTLTGCNGTVNSNTYKTVATTQVTVSAAMAGWNVYDGTGKATIAQEQAVKSAYQKYQAAIVAVCDAGALLSAGSTASAQDALNLAVANANQSITDLVNVIQSFTK
jgi:hypothetical protein